MRSMHVNVAINGEKHEADVEPRLLLVHLIRDVFRLTGTHIGCDTTHCGACTVLLDGRPVKSCTVFAVQAHNRQLMTVEGARAGRQAPSAPGRLHGGARAAVRVLHARHADDEPRVPQEASGTDGG